MARTPRLVSPLDLYHVCDRGVDKRAVFADDSDREQFIQLLAKSLKDPGRKLLAWCLMTNHIHLVVQMDMGAMSDMMQFLIGSYAQAFNAKHDRSGNLFESRFRSQPIDTERYLLAAIRYVHQNPLKAKMTPTCDYPWSSYTEYLGKPVLTDTSLVLGILGGEEGFLSLHRQEDDDPRLFDVDNGWKMDGDEAWSAACRVLGTDAERLDVMSREERDENIRRLLRAHLPGTYIAKFAHVSPATVSRVRKATSA